jgi:hypothetical protein
MWANKMKVSNVRMSDKKVNEKVEPVVEIESKISKVHIGFYLVAIVFTVVLIYAIN